MVAGHRTFYGGLMGWKIMNNDGLMGFNQQK